MTTPDGRFFKIRGGRRKIGDCVMKVTTRFFLFLVFMISVFAPLNGSAQPSDPSQVGDRLVDLKKCIDYLEKTGNLVRVKSEVDAKHELAGIAKMYEGKKCVFFLLSYIKVC